MKFLLDMNLSPSWVDEFSKRGFEAVHWSKIGAFHAKDEVIMAYARKNGYCVFTHDLDFGTMLAVTGADSPSVIQARTQDVSPKAFAEPLFKAVNQFAQELEMGALLVVDLRKQRARLLPLKR